MADIKLTKEEKWGFEFLGITKFWEAGYTGKNVRIMSDEKIIEDYYNTERWKKVICPTGYQKSTDKWHGSAIMFILQDVCPDATFYTYPFGVSLTGSKCADYIIENNIHLFTTSNTGGLVKGTKAKEMQRCIDNGCTFFCCAGNKYGKELVDEAKSELHLAIGGVDEDGKGGWQRSTFASAGKELDYVTITMYGIGTSYNAPTFCGMCGLVQDFFIDKAGRALNRAELISFIDDNLIEAGTPGFDIHTGKGLFILPNPADIDIEKYCSEYKEQSKEEIDISNVPEKGNDKVENKIEMFIDKTYMYINGEKVEIDTAPFIKNGRTFVPIRFITEYLGKTVEWDDKEKKIIIK